MIGSKRERVKGSGVWELRVSIGRNPVTGNYGYRSKTFKGTAAAATRELSRFHASLEGNRVSGSTATMNDLLDRWLEVVDRDRSPTTATGYRSKVDVHVRPGLGPMRVAAITADDLDRLYRAMAKTPSRAPRMKGRPVSARTIRQVHAIISSALTQAFKWGWVATNVAKAATPPSVRKHELELPEVAQIRTLAVAVAEASPDMAQLIGLSLKLGCRRGEVCALQWRDVDLDGAEIRLHRNVVRKKGHGLVEKDTKAHQERTVSIDAQVVAMLRARRDDALELARFDGVRLPSGALVFPAPGEFVVPRDPDGVSKLWRRLCRENGLPDSVRLHDLRHLNATVLLDAGMPLSVVSYRLGHVNESTTSNIYSHVVKASDRRAAEVAGELL